LFKSRLEKVVVHWGTHGSGVAGLGDWLADWIWESKPPKHVWIFASAGNQKNADVMIPELLNIPAQVHGISCEPMTGPVEFDKWFWKLPAILCKNCPKDVDCECGFKTARENGHNFIDVVIFGGESDQSRKARRCDVDWIRQGVEQCQAAGVLPYVKQLGSNSVQGVTFSDTPLGETEALTISLKHKAGADINEFPEDLRVRELPEAH
jgi:hypothetical protein